MIYLGQSGIPNGEGGSVGDGSRVDEGESEEGEESESNQLEHDLKECRGVERAKR